MVSGEWCLLVGWRIGLLIGRSVGWRAGGLVGWLVVWFVCCCACRVCLVSRVLHCLLLSCRSAGFMCVACSILCLAPFVYARRSYPALLCFHWLLSLRPIALVSLPGVWAGARVERGDAALGLPPFPGCWREGVAGWIYFNTASATPSGATQSFLLKSTS